MGAVYEAVHEKLGRRAAIKVLHPELVRNPEIARRFEQEAYTSNKVRHPGLVDVYEITELADGTTCIIMEFLDGETLDRRLARVGSLRVPASRQRLGDGSDQHQRKHLGHTGLPDTVTARVGWNRSYRCRRCPVPEPRA